MCSFEYLSLLVIGSLFSILSLYVFLLFLSFLLLLFLPTVSITSLLCLATPFLIRLFHFFLPPFHPFVITVSSIPYSLPHLLLPYCDSPAHSPSPCLPLPSNSRQFGNSMCDDIRDLPQQQRIQLRPSHCR